MELRDYKETFCIVTHPQYTERDVLHMETPEFMSGDTKFTLVFIQTQDLIRNRLHYIYHISHV